MSESIIPAVLLRALSEYKFVGHPLWKMADGKDHVRVELTFHKTLPMLPVYKRRAESRLASGLTSPQLLDNHHQQQPDQRLQHANSRQCQRRRTPPAPQTLQLETPATITVQRPLKTAQITPSPIIQRPVPPPPSPESPPTKKPFAIFGHLLLSCA